MKKAGLFFLCLAVFLLAVAGGYVWLFLTPRGALRSDTPDKVMQAWLDQHDAAYLRDEYLRQSPAPVTEFEDAAAVSARLYDAAVREGDLTFREEHGAERSAQYILSAGDTDLFRADISYNGKSWELTGLKALDTIRGGTHSISVLLPEDAVLLLNGVEAGEAYIAERGLLYPDMTELELGFDAYPTRVRYEIGGLYETPAVEASRPEGLVLLSGDGVRWEYTLPDAAGHAFAVRVPQGSLVTVNGAELTDRELIRTETMTTKLDVPEAARAYLPSDGVYAAGGLYSVPEIAVTAPDGTELTAEPEGELLVYSLPGTPDLYERCHERVESFLRDLIDYGAGHSWSGKPGAYVAPGSEVNAYLTNASASLHWTVNVNLTFQDVSSSEYIPLGDGTFLCRGHADFTTKTAYQTREISMDYDMLWLEQDGNWMLWDLAFA